MEILNNVDTAESIKNGFLISLFEESEDIDLDLQPIADAIADFNYMDYIGTRTINDLIAKYQEIVDEEAAKLGVDEVEYAYEEGN